MIRLLRAAHARRARKRDTRLHKQLATIRAGVLDLAHNYETASRGDQRPDGRPTPSWLGDIAAELRTLVSHEGAAL